MKAELAVDRMGERELISVALQIADRQVGRARGSDRLQARLELADANQLLAVLTELRRRGTQLRLY